MGSAFYGRGAVHAERGLAFGMASSRCGQTNVTTMRATSTIAAVR
jgi:hypothetical protein